jgi:hypothetical protein
MVLTDRYRATSFKETKNFGGYFLRKENRRFFDSRNFPNKPEPEDL